MHLYKINLVLESNKSSFKIIKMSNKTIVIISMCGKYLSLQELENT